MRNFKKNITVAIIVGTMLTSSAYANAAQIDESKTTNEFENWYVSANSGLNCRTEPTEEADNIIKIYAKGTELQIIGVDETGKWWETWDGETQGWCYSTYFVENKEDLNNNSLKSLNGSVGAYLGNFKVTGYTPSPSENGGYSVTAMGDNLWDSVGWAIAVDPKVIPLGTKVYIEGIGYRVARDTGGAIKGNKIDVLTSSNAESYAITGNYNVYLVE